MAPNQYTKTEYNHLVEKVRKYDQNADGVSNISIAYRNRPFPSVTELKSLLKQLAGGDKNVSRSALRMLICLAEVYEAEPGSANETKQQQLRDWLRKTVIRPELP